MAGKFDRDKLFIALQKLGKSEHEAESILTEVDGKGGHDFAIELRFAEVLARQFHRRHQLYHVWVKPLFGLLQRCLGGGFVNVRAVSRCVQPGASWVACIVCETLVKTCNEVLNCPVHPHGAKLTDVHPGKWACSPDCWEIRRLVPEAKS